MRWNIAAVNSAGLAARDIFFIFFCATWDGVAPHIIATHYDMTPGGADMLRYIDDA